LILSFFFPPDDRLYFIYPCHTSIRTACYKMNNQGGDLYYLDYSFASGIEDEKEKAACNQAA